MSHTLTVERLPCSNLYKAYYRVSAGKNGGQPVTVRIGWQGKAVCLTCVTRGAEASMTCEHAKAADAWDKAHVVADA